MFDPHLVVGEVLTEKQVHDVFSCQTTFGIRMSKKNNLFVIMSGTAKKQIYHDEWKGDVLHYCGTDINSDNSDNQTLKKGKGNNNAQLYSLWYWDEKNGPKPQVFLFVKQKANACVYKGEVIPVEEPYIAPRRNDPTKKVYVFPLKVKELSLKETNEDYMKAEDKNYKLPMLDLYAKVRWKEGELQPIEVNKKYDTITTYYERNPQVAAFAKMRANGICDLCGQPAPFVDKNNNPYLESHHIEWLSRGGADIIDNVSALCPNCHRRMHVLDGEEDIKALKKRIEDYAKVFKGKL